MKYYSFFRIIKFVFLSIVLTFSDIHAICQDVQADTKIKNSIQISGSSAIFFGGFTITYERNIVQSKHFNLNIEGGFGGYYFFDEPVAKGFKIPIQINYLIGLNKSFFEVSFGACYFDDVKKYSKSPFKEITPLINIGYRSQSQNQFRGRVIRIFFGNTTGFGVSFGITF
jgi:hypothetical protein